MAIIMIPEYARVGINLEVLSLLLACHHYCDKCISFENCTSCFSKYNRALEKN